MTQHYLATPLRRVLEKTIKEARIVAEAGAADAIRRLGVAEAKAPAYLSDDEKELRRRLRAHARTLGDRLFKDSDEQEVKRLVEAAAYAHWHRMLFARFLAERGLLRHPEHDVPVTLEDCREIAQEEGATDAWAVAERYAASMLPAVFRIDDPVLSLTLDAAQNQSLHRLVTNLDDDIFQAEDSLGWSYQFWRVAEKQRIDESGIKIGADEISAVTQLFTEPYMVRFLLHNTLGAWWAGKILAARPELAKNAADEDVLRAACSLPGYSFDMLRFVRWGGESAEVHWRPAAGTFTGWPKEAKDITMLDPCCGSGHFLTEALAILSALRRAEEGLSDADSVAVVLRDNLNGLEIDGRCVQIASFAVALTAWRIGGWQILPLPHIAWVGAPPPLPKVEFLALGDDDKDLQHALAALHDLFTQAPILGSLLEPTGGDLVDPMRIARVEQLLEPLLQKTRMAEPENVEGVIAARGMSDAVSILAKKYTLQATNVPFLGRGKQSLELSSYIDRRFSDAKTDLATVMVSRMLKHSLTGGVVSVVTPQNWYFQSSYRNFRSDLLQANVLNIVCDLGPAAFLEMNWWAARTALTVITNERPVDDTTSFAFTARNHRDPTTKSQLLLSDDFSLLAQASQQLNPDARIVTEHVIHGELLSKFASAYQGIATADFDRFGRTFWEPSQGDRRWAFQVSTVKETLEFGGRSNVILWESGSGELSRSKQARIQGLSALSRKGIAISQMRTLPVTLYSGELFDNNCSALVLTDEEKLPSVWCFCSSEEYRSAVRKVNPKVSVTNATLTKVSFDFAYWSKVAAEKYPTGLPEPYSNDPTQWLFHGHPAKAEKGTALHVALARLCGYRWPAETDTEMRLSAEAREWTAKAAVLPDGDQDGILMVPGGVGEKPLADRLSAFLAAAFEAEWSNTLERRLVAEADEVLDKKRAKDGSLEAWLRDRAFRQHCVLFHQRPFLWHIWDGVKDGFSVFVHYHRFNQANLRKLTYTMLGDWLRSAKHENNDLRYEKGRELQQMLEKVLEGEKPYDIFVRWKPLARQPLGWDPDLDDGVRMNIRPFMTAEILREQPKGIKWTKDRGNDTASAPWYSVFKGERINDYHTALEEKRAARSGNLSLVAAK
jgi:hypothetical protein